MVTGTVASRAHQLICKAAFLRGQEVFAAAINKKSALKHRGLKCPFTLAHPLRLAIRVASKSLRTPGPLWRI
jgi:hypothetical protein